MRFPSGRHLRAARVLAGLSRKQLAEAAGVHFNSVAYWEGKTGTLTGYAVDKMAAVLAAHGISTGNSGALLKAA